MTQKHALGAAIALSLACADAAQAHPKLLSAAPAAGQPAVAAKEIRITFSEPLIARFSGVTVKGPRGAVATKPSILDAANSKVLVTPLAAALSPGRYEVAWRAVSTDTHRVTGHYAFTVN